ncbi:MAG: peptidylprolyl isomerase [Segetibacter sp.]|nr:peptidylprolyl isomerase [Segetibacter sp.]
MHTRIFFIIFCLICFSCKKKYANPHIEIQTKAGNIEIELYPGKAPKSVAAFLSYIDSGYYKNASFYRVLNLDNQPSDAYKAELIQGGIYRSKNKPAAIPGIPHETTQQTGILHKDGVISLARLEPGTATTEFFICIGDQPGFDYGGLNNPDKQGYAAFGKVVKGMDIVRTIYNRPEDDGYFHRPVYIFDIVRL